VAKCRLEAAEKRIIDPVKEPAEFKALERKLSGLKSYLTGDVFDLTSPNCLEERLTEHFDQHWPAGIQLETVSQKLHAYHDWHPFWQKLGPAWLETRKKRVLLKQAVSKANKAKGRSGAEKKARKKWIQFTQEFLTWTKKLRITQELIDGYPKQEGIPESKGREFLHTLLTASGSIGSHKALEETLEVVGIKLKQEYAEECFAVLFEGKIPDP
jgi:hypothetical protein